MGKYLGMTPFGQQLEVRLLELSVDSKLQLINERSDTSKGWRRWLGASSPYSYVQEIALRWKGHEVALMKRTGELEEEDRNRPALPPPAARLTTEPATDPESHPRAQRAERASGGRVERPKGRTLKQAFAERFAAGDTDEQAWLVVKAEFSLPDSKKGYAKWYRKHGEKK